MTKDEAKTVNNFLGVLFSSFPQSALADVDMQVRAFADAVKEYEAIDVLSAIDRFRAGLVPGHDAAFCPSSAQLCVEVRKHRDVRRAVERRGSLKLVPALPANHFQNRIKA